jgi:hypothetical protein
MTVIALPKFSGAAKYRTPDELDAFTRIVANAGYDPVAVGAIVELETGRTWSPKVKGAKAFSMAPGYAIGLLQFSPDTARKLGTSTAQMAAMSFVEQAAFIPRYYAMFGGPSKFSRPADYYAAGFGTGVGASDSWVMAAKGDVRYDANTGLDVNRDDKITMADLSDLVTRAVTEASKKGAWLFDLDASSLGAIRARYVTATPLESLELMLLMKWSKLGQ